MKVAVLAVLGVIAAPVRSALGEGRPNVLFIAVDDLRPQLGCYGDPLAKTPNIDRLAAQGMLFERAYCQQAICMASRASLMSGYRPDFGKIYGNGPLYRHVPDAWSLNRHFQKQGYETISIGKVYHHGADEEIGWSQRAVHPKGRGAGRGYLTSEAQRLASDGADGRGPPCEAADVPDSAYPDGEAMEVACSQLHRLKTLNRPFYLAVGFLKPHLPFNAPRRYWDLYAPDRIPLPSYSAPPKNSPACALTDWSELRKYHSVPKKGALSPEMTRQLIQGYYACVSYVDALIGRLLERLERLGLASNTVVVLWADHGWKLGDFGMWCKHTNYELDTRVPLIIRAPGDSLRPGRTRGLAELVDLYPTLCELCGLELPGHLQGTSLVPLLRDPGLEWKRAAFSQYPRGDLMGDSVRTDRYRYTEWRKMEDGAVTARELYDFQTDPQASVNLADEAGQAAAVRQQAAILREGWTGARPRSPKAAQSRSVTEARSPCPVLYNGIVLPEPWPPQSPELTRQPAAPPPYLVHPPEVIPIDVGRQLFVDDFLVQETTLARTYHRPEYHPASPVLGPDRPWEGAGGRARAAPFSDGVWYDPADRLFKMWYWAGAGTVDDWGGVTCYATSRDGLHWDKPELDVVPGTNIVLRDEPGVRRNSSTVWLDLSDPDPLRRYKMFRVAAQRAASGAKKAGGHRMLLSFSADGIHWRLAGESDPCGDRSTVFYNPFRRVWVYSLRDAGQEVSRCRAYCEHADWLAGARWERSHLTKTWWTGADRLDPDRADLRLRRVPERPWDLVPSQLYNLDCVAYESLLLGLFSIWRGQPLDRPKINELEVGFSRDGFHWQRPDRRPFCPVSEGKDDWNWGNVQSAGGCCLVVEDRLFFYVGGVSGRRGAYHPDPSYTGLAVLRRDGFASLDAGPEEGSLTTRPIRFRGQHLFVNVDAPQGRLLVEILDLHGRPLPPFTRKRCLPIVADSTIQAVRWKDAPLLAKLADQPLRLRFHLARGRLYSFWVSPDASGASHGYVAAGGPGLTGATDTAGQTDSAPR